MREKAEASAALVKKLTAKLDDKPEEKPVASGTTFDLAILKTSKPEGVAADEKEKYLSDAQFLEAFKMDKAAFYKLVKWKQQKLKKEIGLF